MTAADLAALLEQIAEDERVAGANALDLWPGDTLRRVAEAEMPYAWQPHDVSPQRIAHILHFDPRRVLAECRAKRRILERHAPRVAVEGPHEGELICGCSNGVDEFHATLWPCPDVEDIASVYAAREGAGESTT